MRWALVEGTEWSVLEVLERMNGKVLSSERASHQMRDDMVTLGLELERLKAERDGIWAGADSRGGPWSWCRRSEGLE
jgi:hypothetical protein